MKSRFTSRLCITHLFDQSYSLGKLFGLNFLEQHWNGFLNSGRPGRTSEGSFGTAPDELLKQICEIIPGQISERISESIPGRNLEGIPGRVPEGISEVIPRRISESIFG